MFGRKKESPLPEIPGVCLTCGAREPLAPAKFTFRYATASVMTLVVLAPVVGILLMQRMLHRIKLPVCGVCSAHLRRAKLAAALSALLFIPACMLSAFLADYNMLFLLIPPAYIVAAYAYHGAERGRGTPKTAFIDRDRLVLAVPGHGELRVYERPPKVGRRAKRQAAAA